MFLFFPMIYLNIFKDFHFEFVSLRSLACKWNSFGFSLINTLYEVIFFKIRILDIDYDL